MGYKIVFKYADGWRPIQLSCELVPLAGAEYSSGFLQEGC